MANTEFEVKVNWQLQGDDFSWDKYSRRHNITFSNGQTLTGSSAPDYFGDLTLVNPEQSLVSAVSACHMLTFLAVASKKKMKLLSYEDSADCELGKNDAGAVTVTKITLRPRARFADPQPSRETLEKMHESASRGCFVGNAVKAEIITEIQD